MTFSRSSNRLFHFFNQACLAGFELEDALRECRQLKKIPLAASLCYWKGKGELASQVAESYLSGIRRLGSERLDCSLSIQAPAIEFDRTCIARVLEGGRKNAVRVHFDSWAPGSTDPTLALIDEVVGLYPDLGCTLPGRWRRSLRDADWAMERDLRVRVVKGQWADPSIPGMDSQRGFLRIIDRLAGRCRHVSVATHDAPLAQEALRRLVKTHTPCELELLHSFPTEKLREIAKVAGVRSRLCLSYGPGWVPYCISKVIRNPRILGRVICDRV